jgi:phospholipid transport system substrate-binding protein
MRATSRDNQRWREGVAKGPDVPPSPRHVAAGALSLPRRTVVQIGVLLAAWPAVAQDDVTAPVARLQAALLSVSEGEGFAARRRRLEPVVAEAFDFRTMSRIAVGSAWAGFDDAERAALAEAFADYAAANYAASFDKPSDLAFEQLGTRPGEGGRTWVETRLVRPADEPVRFDYLIQASPDEPAIVNVVVDGTLNELARRRAEFRALLDAGGLDHLLATLARAADEADE